MTDRPGHRAHHPRAASTSTTGSSARRARGRSTTSCGAHWAVDARGVGRAHPDVRPAGGRGGRRAARALSRRGARRVALARDQARVHRPAARAPPARVRRDLLQLGGLPRARPALLPQRVHLPAGRDLHRAPRRRRADLPLLLPGARRPADHRPRGADELRARQPVPGSGAGRAVRHPRPSRPLPGPVPRLRQLPDPGAVVALLPPQERRTSSGKAVNGTDEYPFLRPAAAQRRRHDLRRHAAAQAREHRPRLQPRPVVLHGRHGGAVGHVAFLQTAAAEQAEGGALHADRPAEAGQDALLPRPHGAHAPLDRPLRPAAGHAGAWSWRSSRCRRSPTSSR